MDENAKKIQREIAKDKIQVILASIALAVLIIMEFYIMINFKSNFIAMAVGILLMIVALFFLISALMDISLKQKDIEQEKYEEIYNAQKASYLVIKKSFDEMEQRLRVIEENSSLPAEDIINAQKAVAKVTISRSKENTDALMNSNDELINQLLNIQEKIDSNNDRIIEKQQTIIKESNFDIQQKITELTSQISIIESKIQNGIPVMAAQPMQVVTPQKQEPVINEMPMEEAVDDLGLDLDAVVEEEPIVDDLGLDLDAVIEDTTGEEAVTEDIALEELQVEEMVTEELPAEELSVEEIPVEEPQPEEIIQEEAPVEEAPVEEIPAEEPQPEETIQEEAPVEEAPVEEPQPEETVQEEASVEEATVEETQPEEIVSDEVVDDLGLDLDAALEEAPAEEMPIEKITSEEPAASDDPGSNLDALLEEIGETVEESAPEPEPEPEAEPEEPKDDSIVIPDVGVDLTDPNRVMSPEEIEKLFANI